MKRLILIFALLVIPPANCGGEIDAQTVVTGDEVTITGFTVTEAGPPWTTETLSDKTAPTPFSDGAPNILIEPLPGKLDLITDKLTTHTLFMAAILGVLILILREMRRSIR